MMKEWITLNDTDGLKHYVQVAQIQFFSAHAEGGSVVFFAGEDAIHTPESPEQIANLIGIT